MKQKPSALITSLIYTNLPYITVTAFFFLVGVSLGAFTELLLSDDAKENMRSFLDFHLIPSGITEDSLSLSDLFIESATTNLGLFLIILLAGLTVIGFPAALPTLLYKGAALGFSSALLMDTLHSKGVLMVFLTLLPPNIILVPSLCCAAVSSLRFASSAISEGPLQIKKNLSKNIGSFMGFQALMAILILVGCFIESFISPLLQQILG